MLPLLDVNDKVVRANAFRAIVHIFKRCKNIPGAKAKLKALFQQVDAQARGNDETLAKRACDIANEVWAKKI